MPVLDLKKSRVGVDVLTMQRLKVWLHFVNPAVLIAFFVVDGNHERYEWFSFRFSAHGRCPPAYTLLPLSHWHQGNVFAQKIYSSKSNRRLVQAT